MSSLSRVRIQVRIIAFLSEFSLAIESKWISITQLTRRCLVFSDPPLHWLHLPATHGPPVRHRLKFRDQTRHLVTALVQLRRVASPGEFFTGVCRCFCGRLQRIPPRGSALGTGSAQPPDTPSPPFVSFFFSRPIVPDSTILPWTVTLVRLCCFLVQSSAHFVTASVSMAHSATAEYTRHDENSSARRACMDCSGLPTNSLRRERRRIVNAN